MKKTLSLIIILMALSLLAAVEFTMVHTPVTTVENTVNRDEVELTYAGAYDGNGIGTGGAVEFSCAARFTADELSSYYGGSIQNISFVIHSADFSNVTVKIWEGGSYGNPGTEVYSADVTSQVTVADWTTHELASSVELQSGNEYWIGYAISATGDHPAAVDGGPMVAQKGSWMLFNGAWDLLPNLGATLDFNWCIKAMVQTQALAHDVKVVSLQGVNAVMTPGAATPAVAIKNIGSNDETVSVSLTFTDLDGVEEYSETVAGQAITAGETLEVTMPEFTVGADKAYTAAYSVELAGDEDPSNNDATMGFTSYTTPRDMVVIEEFTGTWCGYCPGAAMAMEDFIANGKNVAIVAYHGGDNYENTAASARDSYYNISGYPTCVFDGTTPYVGGSPNQSIYSALLPIYNEKIQINSPFTIQLNTVASDDTYNLLVTINKLGQIDASNLKLHLALTESGIQENWQGQTELHFVERLMAPDANGTSLDFSAGNEIQIPLDITTQTAWNLDELEVVAFIQDPATKMVYQGTKAMLNEIGGVKANHTVTPAQFSVSNYPNPFNPTTTIQLNIAQDAPVQLHVYNLRGQKVATLANETLQAGTHNFTWNGMDDDNQSVSSGMYFYKAQVGSSSQTHKMLLLK
jgi:thiol-disulfide isomerase/thioredoxin